VARVLLTLVGFTVQSIPARVGVSNQVLGQDWLDQHAGRICCLDPKASRGFVRPGQEDDLAGMGLPDLADRLDAIQSAPQANIHQDDRGAVP
jgi:hypothetical protein